MRRRLLTGLLLLSIVMFLTAVVLWVRSYRCPEQLSRFWPRHYLEINSYGGRFEFDWTTYPRPLPRDDSELRLRHESISSEYRSRGTSWPARLGFEFDQFHGGSYVMTLFIVPWWALAVLAGVATTACSYALRRDRTRRVRLAAGCCVRCGYDLRATLHRCPECGCIPTPGGSTSRVR